MVASGLNENVPDVDVHRTTIEIPRVDEREPEVVARVIRISSGGNDGLNLPAPLSEIDSNPLPGDSGTIRKNRVRFQK